MATKEIILYRYHNNFQLIAKRLEFIKKMEPDKPIYGIYGGKKSHYNQACRYLDNYLEDNFFVPVEDSRWKWLHADIIYKMWYEQVGNNINFENAYILEWDIIILEQFKNLYPPADHNNVICTGLIPIEKVSNFWYWMNEKNKPKVEAFYRQVDNYYKKPFTRYASLGPGFCAPKSFFERLQELKLFEADISDEIKIPVWSQIMGLTPISNNFYKKWFSFFEMRYFNANVANIKYNTIVRELKKKNGRRVFHPFRDHVGAEVLYELYKNSKYSIKTTTNTLKETKTIHPMLYKLHCKLYNLNYKIS